MAEELTQAVESGDRRRSLEAIRDRLAAELVDAVGRDAAPLAKELRAVIAELDSMPGEEASTVADLTARIAARRQQAASGL